MVSYGDISVRTAVHAVKRLQKRALPHLVLEKFGQAYVMPTNSTKQAVFRRYEALDPTPNALTEGVAPTGKSLTKTDVTATLVQYGDIVELTDVILDTHEDPVLQETVDLLGEQAAQMIETMRFGIIKAGTTVFFASGVANRAAVVNAITLGDQRQITRQLKRQNARKITKIIRSTPSYGTANVAPSFICLVHPDAEGDIRNLSGFTAVEDYGSHMGAYDSEIGKCEDVRYVYSTIFAPWADAGGIAATMLATTNAAVAADVYPFIYIAMDAYGIVPLKGKSSITPTVINPTPSKSDPLGQKGIAGWKSMQTCVILNDLFMARLEATCKLNP
jgi:N4-gp56 family major capsid protein